VPRYLRHGELTAQYFPCVAGLNCPVQRPDCGQSGRPSFATAGLCSGSQGRNMMQRHLRLRSVTCRSSDPEVTRKLYDLVSSVDSEAEEAASVRFVVVDKHVDKHGNMVPPPAAAKEEQQRAAVAGPATRVQRKDKTNKPDGQEPAMQPGGERGAARPSLQKPSPQKPMLTWRRAASGVCMAAMYLITAIWSVLALDGMTWPALEQLARQAFRYVALHGGGFVWGFIAGAWLLHFRHTVLR